MFTALRCCVLSTLIALASCKTSKVVLFHADFDADTLGAAPADPPGAPAGDGIHVPGSAAVVSNHSALGSKALMISEGGTWGCFFQSDLTLGEFNNFRIFLTGSPADLEDGELAIQVHPMGTDLNPVPVLTSLELRNGGIHGPGFPGPLSYDEDRIHSIIVNIDLVTRKYQFTVMPGSTSPWFDLYSQTQSVNPIKGISVSLTVRGDPGGRYAVDHGWIYGLPGSG